MKHKLPNLELNNPVTAAIPRVYLSTCDLRPKHTPYACTKSIRALHYPLPYETLQKPEKHITFVFWP